ncbi:MAG TPA: heavy-metal-associated domain-containing protein [Anaerolineae bacterium]
MTKQVFRVTDMHCSSCVMRLEGLEDDLPGVRRIKASYQKQQMEVEYDEKQLTPDQIVFAIRRLGYTVLD